MSWTVLRTPPADDISESSVRTIGDNEEKILQFTADLGTHAHLSKIVRNSNIVKMEEMLRVRIQDVIQKKFPVDTCSIPTKALDFHGYLEAKSPNDESFTAGKGWFEKFKNRFSLHNVKFPGF